MTIDEVKELMRSSKSEQEWIANVKRVKLFFDGYPSFWYKEIVLSGLVGEVTKRFEKDDKIHIEVIK